MGHFSVAPESYTPEYSEYERSIDKENVRPSAYHKDWKDSSTAKRFVWGDFSCLSYTWGDPKDTRTIRIDGHEVTVGANLEAAFRSFRQQEEFRSGLMLWADALCINQDDISEKEKTIKDMQEIYLGAHTVTVWLGAGNSETDAALYTIRSFVARYSNPVEDPADVLHSELTLPPRLWFANVVYPAIVQLMDRPYWRRLWIMQEITACAPCENIYLGNHCISWTDLFVLLKSYMAFRDVMELNDEYTETLGNSVLKNVKQAYVLATSAELYRYLSGLGKLNISLKHSNVSSWLYLGRTAEVTDERDRVYGLLGLLPEYISSRVMPNYAKSVEGVYMDLAKAVIEATGCFDESFVGSTVEQSDIASWAINMRDTESRRPKNGQAGGYENPYDSFLKTGQMYCIVVRKKPTSDDPNPDESNDAAHYEFSDDGALLTVVGIHIDTVEGISGSVIKNSSPLRILDVAWKPSERPLNLRGDTTARETILRVMLADAAYVDEPHGTIFDVPFFEDFEPDATLVEELHNNGWSNILRSDAFRIFQKFRIKKGNYPLFEGKKLGEWFTRKVIPCDEEKMRKALSDTRTVSERTFFTTEKGNLGSTGVAIKEGDQVFVALGCSYPFLVRPEGDAYRIVGECYLDGFMNSEALDMVANGEANFEKIQVR
ncbi:heterokaryon incompatibility protein-domain-containing protein [Hyaloscypha finlandica]|nr:heterokaryon incompatibility protein-domain-containing protein [Hyaloscypha finlandica]